MMVMCAPMCVCQTLNPNARQGHTTHTYTVSIYKHSHDSFMTLLVVALHRSPFVTCNLGRKNATNTQPGGRGKEKRDIVSEPVHYSGM